MDIHVGSLPFKLKEEELKLLFEKYGIVSSVKLIKDKITRQNKGYGFVVMPSETEAKKAINELNGFEILDRTLQVEISQAKDIQVKPRLIAKRKFK